MERPGYFIQLTFTPAIKVNRLSLLPKHNLLFYIRATSRCSERLPLLTSKVTGNYAFTLTIFK